MNGANSTNHTLNHVKFYVFYWTILIFQKYRSDSIASGWCFCFWFSFFFKILFIYSWERQRHRQREKQAPCGEAVELNPGSWDHDLSRRQTRNHWATQASWHSQCFWLVNFLLGPSVFCTVWSTAASLAPLPTGCQKHSSLVCRHCQMSPQIAKWPFMGKNHSLLYEYSIWKSVSCPRK